MKYLQISLLIASLALYILDGAQGVSVTDKRFSTGYSFILGTTPIAIDKNVQLVVNTTLVSDGGYVQLNYTGITPSKNNSDYVVVFTPGDIESVQNKVASKYLLISSLPGNFNQTGSGSYIFFLVSSRASFRFAYFQGDPLYPILKALSPEIQLKNPNAPLHGHIGITGDNGEVAIQWNTRDCSYGDVVRYGTSSDKLNRQVRPAYSTRFTQKDLCGPVANISGYVDPGYTHVVFLRNLQPNTKYFYRYGSPEQGFGFSKVMSFRSLNAIGPDEKVQFFATADVGSSQKDNSTLVQNEYASRMNYKWLVRDIEADDRYNLYFLHGDIAYADGQTTIWDNYFSQWSSFLTRIPAGITEGNHERDYFGSGDRFDIAPGSTDGSGGECGVQTYFYFKQPVPFRGQKTNLWYSFNYGPIHFISYSTERPVNEGSEQYNFMINDLKRVDRRITPWVVVAGHRPMYTASNYCCPNQPCANCTQDSDIGTTQILQAAFEDTFYEYNVDIVWNGHVHRYDLTCPVYKTQCQGYDQNGAPKAPIYMCIGNGGYNLSRRPANPLPSYYTNQGGKVIIENGYTRVHANRTHFVQEMIFASNGTLMDRLTIKKSADFGKTFMSSHPLPKY